MVLMRSRRRVRPSTHTTLVLLVLVISTLWFVVTELLRLTARLPLRHKLALVASVAVFLSFGATWAIGAPALDRPVCTFSCTQGE
jgi:hypothetical protein